MSENGAFTVLDGKVYREVRRRAKVGEKIKITAEEVMRESRKGEIRTVIESDNGFPVITDGFWDDGSEFNPSDDEYVVLEPVKSESTAPSDEYLDRLAAAGRKIAELTRRVDELERMVGELTEAKAEMVESKPKLTRDDVIERAKADVAALLAENSGWDTEFDFVVNRKKRTVVALYKICDHVYDRGKAKAAPGDVFNVHIGKAIALRRALGLEIPAEYVNAPAPVEPKAGDVVRVSYDEDDPLRIIEGESPRFTGYYVFTNGFHTGRDNFEIIDDSRTGTEAEDYSL